MCVLPWGRGISQVGRSGAKNEHEEMRSGLGPKVSAPDPLAIAWRLAFYVFAGARHTSSMVIRVVLFNLNAVFADKRSTRLRTKALVCISYVRCRSHLHFVQSAAAVGPVALTFEFQKAWPGAREAS